MRRIVFELVEGLRIAGRAIWVNKLRSVLTTLGIIIGIASVTLMATLIDGVNNQFEKSLSVLGADVLYVSKWPWGANINLDWWNYINRPAIEADLVDQIRTRSRYADGVAPLVDTERLAEYNGRSIEAEVTGSTPEYGPIRDTDMAEGRFFTQTEERAGRAVCVIGADIAETLFPIGTPLGKSIDVGSKPCLVIGVQEKQGRGLFGNITQDTNILMPFSTFKRYYGLSRWRSITIMVKVPTLETIPAAKDELTGILRTARKVAPGDDNNFEINDQERVRSSFTPVKVAIYGVGLFLTALALVVGGIGVMNIMFVSVRERTREIGVRKAVGAKKRTILLQFLIEAIIVCLIGGLIGIGVSFVLSIIINAVGLTAALPFSIVLVAFTVCVSIGIIFGLAPAWQAATAEPIQALRYE